MEFNFDSSEPIYIQLIDELRLRIIIGYYEKGSKLPSVRELASLTKVNPNTVQRALQELERLELIETQRTNGKFVTTKESVITKEKEKLIKQTIDNFLITTKRLNISQEEIIEYLENN